MIALHVHQNLIFSFLDLLLNNFAAQDFRAVFCETFPQAITSPVSLPKWGYLCRTYGKYTLCYRAPCPEVLFGGGIPPTAGRSFHPHYKRMERVEMRCSLGF
jgi:hypothetical protein